MRKTCGATAVHASHWTRAGQASKEAAIKERTEGCQNAAETYLRTDLLELHNVGVDEPLVVEDLPLDILGNLYPAKVSAVPFHLRHGLLERTQICCARIEITKGRPEILNHSALRVTPWSSSPSQGKLTES